MAADKRERHPEQVPAILLIDDVPMVLDLLSSLLEELGYPILCLESGKSVTEVLDRHQIALVFCDISLPDIHGVDVLRMIKQHSPEIQVVMISGKQDFDVVRQVLRERALDYLVKPFVPQEVLATARLGISSYYHVLHHEQLWRDAQRRMGELILLKQVGETTRGSGDLQHLFDKILDTIVQSAGVEVASLMLLKDDGKLHIASSTGLSDEITQHVQVASGEGISGHVVATGAPILVANLDQDSRFNNIDQIGGDRYKNQSVLSVPIFIREKLVGVINVNNKLSGEPFDLEDQSLLLTIANQVALAMENFDLVHHLLEQTTALERTNEDLTRMHRARTRLICNLSHELKTPLTSIMGYVDLCLSFYDKLSAEEIKNNLAYVCEEGTRLERLINGMLRLFSIESERETWQWKSFGIPWSIADTFQYFSHKIADKQLIVDVDIEDNLPDIYADQEKFGMAVSALVDNAVKFNRPGGRLQVMACSRQRHGLDYVYLRIYNEGQTVPMKASKSIFGSYTQLGNINTEKPHGVGIGLALAKVIVDRMLGEILLEKVTGEGTCIGLLLPTEKTYNVIKDNS